jgi:hypothetical protein
MTASEIRLKNFLALFAAFKARNAHLPDKGMLKLFAQHVGGDDRHFSHIKNGRKGIGHALARQIEEAEGKPEGWLDREHGGLEPRDLHERAFMETALALYRTSPAEAQAKMTDFLKTRLGAD